MSPGKHEREKLEPRERDELRNDIEQMCMQHAGPSYAAVASGMHFQSYKITKKDMKKTKLEHKKTTRHGTDNQEKDEKQSQNDKTRLGMEKTVKDKAKSKPEMGQSGTLVRQGSAYNRDLWTWAHLADFRCPVEASSGSLPSVLLPLDHIQSNRPATRVIRHQVPPVWFAEEVHPVLPIQGDTMHERPVGKIRLYTRDPALAAADFNAQDYATLVAHPSPFWKFPEEFLCLVGLSRHYTLDEETYPSFLDKDGEDMDIFAFIHTTDPSKVKVVKREQKEDEPRLLETTVGHTVPLLPVALDHGESELDASVDKLFNEGDSGTQTEQGDYAGGGGGKGINVQPVTETTNIVAEDVIPLQPRCQKKRKTIVADAGGPSHPPKKLREDHRNPSGASEAKATEAIHLRAKASNFETVEKSIRVEVNALNERNTILKKECNALDVKVMNLEASVVSKERELTNSNAQLTSIKSQNNNLVDQVPELQASSSGLKEKLSHYENLTERLEEFQDAQLKVVNDKFNKLYADFMEMALHLEEKFYPYLLTTISYRRWLLTHGMKLAIAKCLNSSEYLFALRAAIGKAIEKGMHDRLSAGITHGKKGRVLTDVAAYNPSAEVDYSGRLGRTLRVIDPFFMMYLFLWPEPFSAAAVIGTDDQAVASESVTDGNDNPYPNVDDVELNAP
ncbi:hypothetical protein Tco_1104846 [Tanacetum coccineum]